MFDTVINKLVSSGLTEVEIAAQVRSSQASINRIRRGKQKNISFELGNALLKLLKEREPLIPPPGEGPPSKIAGPVEGDDRPNPSDSVSAACSPACPGGVAVEGAA